MVTAVAISVAIAIPLGIMAARSDTVDALMRPILDAMQTMPSFVYLVPVIFFFGLGNAPAVVATVVYADPSRHKAHQLGNSPSAFGDGRGGAGLSAPTHDSSS